MLFNNTRTWRDTEQASCRVNIGFVMHFGLPEFSKFVITLGNSTELALLQGAETAMHKQQGSMS